MPLSDHEQRVLNELEQALYRQDPAFAARVKSENVYRYAGRYVKWSCVGFVAGLALMLAAYTWSVALGLVGVLIMFLSLVLLTANLRRMGKAGWQDITHNLHADGIGNAVGDAKGWFRDRFHRDNHDN